MVVKKGRYGPYVSHDGVNATLPSDMAPETVTLEQALPLLDAREARGTGTRKKAPAKPKKVAAKKAAPEAQPDAAPAKAKSPKESPKDSPKKKATKAKKATKTPGKTPSKAPDPEQA